MLKLSCLCGQSIVTLSKRPEFIHACNCILCSKTGAHWGYFHPSEASVSGETQGWSRTDKDAPSAEIRFCATCGSTTHFRLTPGAVAQHGDVMMGVNMRLADEGDLAGIELRFPDGRAWAGTGEFAYVREGWVIGGVMQVVQ